MPSLVLEGLLAGGIDPAPLFVAGDSSGGGLVTSLMYSMQRTGHRPIAGVVLFSPELDMLLDEAVGVGQRRPRHPAVEHPDLGLPARRDPGSAPVSAVDQDVSGWPPTFVSFGGDEMFRDAIRLFVDPPGCGRGGRHLPEEPGMFHVFPILMPWAEGSRRAYRAVGEFVRDHLPDQSPADALAPPPAPAAP